MRDMSRPADDIHNIEELGFLLLCVGWSRENKETCHKDATKNTKKNCPFGFHKTLLFRFWEI